MEDGGGHEYECCEDGCNVGGAILGAPVSVARCSESCPGARRLLALLALPLTRSFLAGAFARSTGTPMSLL